MKRRKFFGATYKRKTSAAGAFQRKYEKSIFGELFVKEQKHNTLTTLPPQALLKENNRHVFLRTPFKELRRFKTDRNHCKVFGVQRQGLWPRSG